MKKMEQTMRWYGPHDIIKLKDLRQAGITGIVNALHQIPVGEVWEIDDIKERQSLIREHGLEWTVVESLPVHEDIKSARGNFEVYIDNYISSLKNLAACGLHVITYNFMPILDWVRTNPKYENPDGTTALLYDQIAFIYFDIYLLKRPNAENDYSEDTIEKAIAYGNSLSDAERQLLFDSVLLGLPGSTEAFTPEYILHLLEGYKDITNEILRANLIHFLKRVTPVCEDIGSVMAIHPDDPPFSVLGLPRIVCTQADLKQLFEAVPTISNGLCYCTGSLGAQPSNDLLSIIDAFEERIHFLHLRNVARDNDYVFRESEHLNGDNPMEAIMEKLVLLMQKRNQSLPMRPDHGFLHSFEKTELYPGYSLIGRLKGLAELRGLERGILHHLQRN